MLLEISERLKRCQIDELVKYLVAYGQTADCERVRVCVLLRRVVFHVVLGAIEVIQLKAPQQRTHEISPISGLYAVGRTSDPIRVIIILVVVAPRLAGVGIAEQSF
jgi:hypothetical protein